MASGQFGCWGFKMERRGGAPRLSANTGHIELSRCGLPCGVVLWNQGSGYLVLRRNGDRRWSAHQPGKASSGFVTVMGVGYSGLETGIVVLIS